MLSITWSMSCLIASFLQLASGAIFDIKEDLIVPENQARIYHCAYDTINVFGLSVRATRTVTELQIYHTSHTETITQTVVVTATATPLQDSHEINQDIIPAGTSAALPWYSMTPEYPDKDTDTGSQGPLDTLLDISMTSAGTNANYSRYPCPVSLASDYTLKSDNSSWQLFCNTDSYYHDLRAHNATNLAVCMQECIKLNNLVTTNPKAYGTQYCIAVTYTSFATGPNANCYLKHAVTTAIYQAYKFDSAKLSSFQLPDALAVSVYSMKPTATLAPPATSIPPAPYQAASPCPYPDKTYYKFANRTNPRISNIYQIFCDTVYYYNDLPGLYTSSFDDCIAACDQWIPIVNPAYDISVHQPCIAITYHQYIQPKNNATTTANCHRKYAISATANGIRPAAVAATRVDSSVPASLIITSSYAPKSTA